MNINIAAESIDLPPAVAARLQPFQPKDAMHNRRIRQPLPGKPGHLPVAENGADRMPSTNFARHTMQPAWSLLGIDYLPDPIGGGRNQIFFAQAVLRKRTPSRAQ